jgi:hypothetical protein
VIISVVYLFVRCLLGCLMMLARHRVSKDAQLKQRPTGLNRSTSPSSRSAESKSSADSPTSNYVAA